MSGAYKIRVRCRNCNNHAEVVIARGRPIDEEECPICGCCKLEKELFTSGYPVEEPTL